MAKTSTFKQLFETNNNAQPAKKKVKMPQLSTINNILNYSKAYKSVSDYYKASSFRFPKELLTINMMLN